MPGPPFALWGIELVVFAAAAGLIGSAVRTVATRWVGSWRALEPIERLLLDLYLGGALVYAVALLPLGLFGPDTFPLLTLLALAYLTFRLLRLGGPAAWEALRTATVRCLSPGPAIALSAAIALGTLELATAISAPTGNTWDASQLGTYTTLLLSRHSVPTDLLGAGLALPVAYPQGAGVWMGSAQLLFDLPPARTALLVTPLFLGLAPLGAYALGYRWLGGARAGATTAVVFAVLATWTRTQVTGSYDFVLSFPLVLLVIALSKDWLGRSPVRWPDAIALGLLAGYAAALSPVGVGWWLIALPLAAALSTGARGAGETKRWFARYLAAVAAALVPVLPSIVVVVLGLGHLGFAPSQPGVGTIAPVGLTGPHIVGYLDPFLFGPTDVWLSPFPVLRAELAALLVLGLLILVALPPSSRRFPALGPFAAATFASALAWFTLEGLASAGIHAFQVLAPVTNGDELAEMMFTVYALLATVPVVVLLERREPLAPGSPDRSPVPRSSRCSSRTATLAFAVGLLLLVPGVAVTATEVPAQARTLYTAFGNVTAEDFQLLAWAHDHLPKGARVLVAPGSAAEFLTSYAPSVRVLYPMVVGFEYPNSTYRDLLDELTNGTLAPNGSADLSTLGADYIAVTGTNTVLGHPFWPDPMLADPAAFPLQFHAGDAYVFAVTAAAGAGTALGAR